MGSAGLLFQFCLHQLQPRAHAHVAVHRRRGDEMVASLLMLADVHGQLAETEVAVGDEGAHPELLSERERVTIVAVSVVRRIAASDGVAEEPQRPRLVAALTALAGKRQGSFGECDRILQLAGMEIDIAQEDEKERLEIAVSARLDDAERALQQLDALDDSP